MGKFKIIILDRKRLILASIIFLISLLTILFPLSHKNLLADNSIDSVNGLIAKDSSHSRIEEGTNLDGLFEKDANLSEDAHEGGKLAIVIDDFGSGRDGVDEMMSIDRHMTFAVMPFLEHTREDAELANSNGYEVIVHLSMEPNYGKLSWLGPRPILSGMEPEAVKEIVYDAFDDVPFASGANIHMGSKASGEENIISAVLDVVKDKSLYFVDSRTAAQPIAKKISAEKGVICYERNVFLDGQQPKYFIKKRLKEAGELALKNGYAIAAGHVGIEGGRVTAESIIEMLPEFDEKNIKLVFVSELGN